MGITACYFIQSKTISHDGRVKYELGAVIPDYGEEDEGPIAGFHQATPSGEALLHYDIGHDPGWKPDQRVYILWTPLDADAEPPAEGWWTLVKRTETENNLVGFTLEPRGKDRPFSWKTEFHLDVDTTFTDADFGKPGQRYLFHPEVK